MALAYFLTWTTYGTRLHGDPRGTVDRDHNRRHTPVLSHSPERMTDAASRLKHPPVVLGNHARQIVNRAIRDHADIRKWRLIALEVRSNHVHVVVTCPSAMSPEEAMAQFKAWGTRHLRSMELVPPSGPVWTDHGSTRWLNKPEHVESAAHYVRDWQDDRLAWRPPEEDAGPWTT